MDIKTDAPHPNFRVQSALLRWYTVAHEEAAGWRKIQKSLMQVFMWWCVFWMALLALLVVREQWQPVNMEPPHDVAKVR